MCHQAQTRLHVMGSYSYDIFLIDLKKMNRSETAGEKNEMCIFSQAKEYVKFSSIHLSI